jgi:FkbM family methyltransferase
VSGVVIDLGCHTHPGFPEDESVHALIDRFQPGVLFGFDPHPDLEIGPTVIGDTEVTLSRSAAWTYDGLIDYDPSPQRPLAASVGAGPLKVACFDLARFVKPGDIVKMDVEGAEYPLIRHLIETGADKKLERLLVEWHQPTTGRAYLLSLLSCPVEEWAPQVTA